MADIAKLISDGADTFLKTEFLSIGICTFFFALVIAFVVEREPGTYYVTIAFLWGALTSVASGYIGMYIAVRANVRTTKAANNSLHDGFVVAFRGGSVLGFCLVGLGLLNLTLLIQMEKLVLSSYLLKKHLTLLLGDIMVLIQMKNMIT